MSTALNPFQAVAAMPRRPVDNDKKPTEPEPSNMQPITATPSDNVVDAEVTAADLRKTAAAPKVKKSVPQRANHYLPDLDLDALDVMTGVKMGSRAVKQTEKWGQLFDVKLAAVGHAIHVPSIYAGGIAAAALKRKKTALAAGKKLGEFPLYKVQHAGLAKGIKGIPDGTSIVMVGRIA